MSVLRASVLEEWLRLQGHAAAAGQSWGVDRPVPEALSPRAVFPALCPVASPSPACSPVLCPSLIHSPTQGTLFEARSVPGPMPEPAESVKMMSRWHYACRPPGPPAGRGGSEVTRRGPQLANGGPGGRLRSQPTALVPDHLTTLPLSYLRGDEVF